MASGSVLCGCALSRGRFVQLEGECGHLVSAGQDVVH